MSLFTQQTRPRFRSHLRCEPAPPDCTFVLTEQSQFLLQGRVFSTLTPLIDGNRTVEDLVDQLRGCLTAAEIVFALSDLKSKGYITTEPPPVSSEREAFWETMGLDASGTATRMATASVSVTAIGGVDPAPMIAILEELEIAVRADADRAVVLVADYIDPLLSTINTNSLRRKRPWLLMTPSGSEIRIGPIFVPGSTGCWACLHERLAAHRKADSYLASKQGVLGPFTPPRATLPSTYQAACALAGTEVARWLADEHYDRLIGRLLTVDSTTLDKREHTLTRRPQCSRCGDATLVATAQNQPIELTSRTKQFTSDGGHRTAPPEQTLRRLAHHVSPITGIVSSLRELPLETDEQGVIASYITDHNFVHMNDDLHFFRESLRARSGGKGKTSTQAKVSAICESIERYSGVFCGDEARVLATADELGAAAIDPNQVMLFSEQQLLERERWLAQRSRITWVANRFDRQKKIEWSPLWALTSGEKHYLPTAGCYYGYPSDRCGDIAQGDSNGCAAGANLEEAVLQGLLELVERDAVAIWWYNRLKRPAVALSSFSDPYFDRVIDCYRSISRELHVLDLTHDIGIPVFAAISRCRNQPEEQIIYGFGAHFDAHIALSRAVSELHQSLPFVIDLPQDGTSGNTDFNRVAAQWWHTNSFDNQPYLRPADQPPRTILDYRAYNSTDLYTDLNRCIKQVEDAGLQVMVMNQSRPDTGVTVVRVVVPGLRHFWPRLAPGRLYDVPVEMGWQAQALLEGELNPWPIYL